jgi:hypothetical protein
VQWSELKHCFYSTVSAMHFGYWMKDDRPTTPKTKPHNSNPKTTPLKISNQTRNELYKKLETAGGV